MGIFSDLPLGTVVIVGAIILLCIVFQFKDRDGRGGRGSGSSNSTNTQA